MRKWWIPVLIVLVVSGLAAYVATNNYESATSYISRLPEIVTSDRVEVVSGVTMVSKGLTVYVDVNRQKLRLGEDEAIRIEADDMAGSTYQSIDVFSDGRTLPLKMESGKHAFCIPTRMMYGSSRDGLPWVKFRIARMHHDPHGQDRELQVRVIHLEMNPAIGESLWVAADRGSKIDERQVKQVLSEATSLAKVFNREIDFVSGSDPEADVVRIGEVTFRAEINMQDAHFCEALCGGPDDDGMIQASLHLIGDPKSAETAVTYCGTQFLVWAYAGDTKDQLYKAYDVYVDWVEQDSPNRYNVLRFRGLPSKELLHCESEFLASSSMTEMVAHIVAIARVFPETLDERLKALPSADEKLMREQVIRPCIQAIADGSPHGKEILGPGYKKFY